MLSAQDIQNSTRIPERPVMQHPGGLILYAPARCHLLETLDCRGLARRKIEFPISGLLQIVAQSLQFFITIGPVVLHFDPQLEMDRYAQLLF